METRIKALREDNDLTQETVAEAIGITQRKYSYLETGVQQCRMSFWSSSLRIIRPVWTIFSA